MVHDVEDVKFIPLFYLQPESPKLLEYLNCVSRPLNLNSLFEMIIWGNWVYLDGGVPVFGR